MKNFLKVAAHQHKDPQVRLGYIEGLDSGSDSAQKILSEMAQVDNNLNVRLAAIEKLSELTSLRGLLDLSGEHAQVIAEAAEKRLIQKFGQGEVSDIAVRALLGTHAPRLAVPLAVFGKIAEQREMALPHLHDEASLLSVVQQSRFHDTRLAAATRLSQHDAIRSALAAMRSKDKVVAKYLQQKLDDEAAAEAELISKRHAVSSCLKSARDLVDGVWTPQHAGKLRALKSTWAGMDPADTREHDASFKLAIADAEQKLQAYLDEHSADVSETPSVKTPAVETGDGTGDGTGEPATSPASAHPQVQAVLQALAPVTIASLATTIEGLQTRANPESASADVDTGNTINNIFAHGMSIAVLFDPPYEINKARPGALQQRIRRVQSLADISTVLPGIDLGEHVYVRELKDHLAQLEDRLGKAKQESADRIKATHRQFAALGGIIKEGKWGPANSMLRRLNKKISGMEPAERSSLNEKLERAEHQLNEMADWQDFAARPKLEALCEQMEALPPQQLEPEALSKRVRELQREWKALGVSRASNELWSRFKTAGDAAYEPCKSWFENKQKERQQKLDAKAALCAQLEKDSPSLEGSPDWKAIARTVNNAKREWSRNRVHDRKPDKALEARFSAALEPFETGLAGQYETNAAEKKALIEKVQVLAEGEITQHSANQAKRLLNAWKLVGVMRRKEDQALWEEFNGHLGTIFKHQHKVAREKERAGLEHVYRARDIIKQLKQIARGDTLDESQMQSLSSEFQSLAEFPERDRKFLLRDYRQALDACSRLQDSSSKRKARAEIEEKNRLVQLCEKLELALEQPDAASEHLIEDVMHGWEATETGLSGDLGNALLARRDAAIEHIKQGTQPDFDSNEAGRRDLLIRMEVAAGVDTPAEDSSRRMSYQLAHLQEGMTSAGVEDKSRILARLDLEWSAAGPVRSVIRDKLHSRYLKIFQPD